MNGQEAVTAPAPAPANEVIQQQMKYVSYCDSCQDPTVDGTGWLRECRRVRGHGGVHASDYPFFSWEG